MGHAGTRGHPADVAVLMGEALAAQQLRRFDEAERLYRSSLSLAPDQPDALHMLGVVRYEMGDGHEATRLILRALDLTEWKYPSYWHNLGLALARCHREQADADRVAGRRRADKWLATRPAPGPREQPRIAVVVPCYNHERFVRRALRSVFEQTYQHIELVVIDDGSTDTTAESARQALAGSPFPHRFVTRSNRGAAATINEGIGLSTAPYINILNSDDWFRRTGWRRWFATSLGAARSGGSVASFASMRRIGPSTWPENDRARTLSHLAEVVVGERETTGFAFLTANVAISSGNLFFSRSLFERIGGFRDLRYNHDWDFCLRALRCAEPVFAAASTYAYRLHGSNTIDGAVHGGGREEADRILEDYIDWGMTDRADAYPMAPSWRDWGMYFVCALIGGGIASRFEPEFLRALAESRVTGQTTTSAGPPYSQMELPVAWAGRPNHAAKLVANERDESRPPGHVSLQKDG